MGWAVAVMLPVVVSTVTEAGSGTVVQSIFEIELGRIGAMGLASTSDADGLGVPVFVAAVDDEAPVLLFLTLVLRSAVPNFTFARESYNERFYIRMYDGSTPPNYSEFSRALYINLPLS